MSSRQTSEFGSSLFSRIFWVLIILMGSSLFWKIGVAIFSDQQLSWLEQGLFGLGIIFFILGLIYVWVKKNDMKKSETFRREKW